MSHEATRGPSASVKAHQEPLPSQRKTTPFSPSNSDTRDPGRSTHSRGWLSSVRRPKTSPGPRSSAFKRSLLAAGASAAITANEDARRDSALAPSTRNSAAANGADCPGLHVREPSSSFSLRKTPSLPTITIQDDAALPSSSNYTSNNESPADSTSEFQAIDTIIPTGGFDDLTSPSQVSFSKRGSMLVGGKRANKVKHGRDTKLGHVVEGAATQKKEHLKAEPMKATKTEKEKGVEEEPFSDLQLSTPCTPQLSPRSTSAYTVRRRAVSQRILSTDEAMLSRKVRAMYKHGNEGAADWDDVAEEPSLMPSYPISNGTSANTPLNGSSLTVGDVSSMHSSRRESVITKEPTELAGGVEDWADIEGGEVDRYGFILPKKTTSQGGNAGNSDGPDGPDEPRIHRVTTVLKLVSEEPRKKGLGRSISRARSSRSANPKFFSHSRRQSQKSVGVQPSVRSNRTTNTRRTPQKPLRQATNRLPHNRDRRLLDEASDMLKLPPGLAELAEQAEGGRTAQAMKQKEMQREEKWRKMAKVVQAGAKSGGMMFEFDVKDPKLVSRTWKGIPDRWRSTAWYAFLAASAKANSDSPSEEELIESFYELQQESSADDIQIDMDVPRTISRHIMFRRRYRGGQRLLFRVLHAMSLYLPETGYVQGMAALAATLLCYYEEDKAFVMLVRLWMHRGLERLYEKGFIGLMDALEDFEKHWLRGGEIAKKLQEELGISSTAYGTRWYLTLFNYSLPFPAQLRVWDVFMLLGDASHSLSSSSKFGADLDVLHATSAALIDATREILLDSDFENAMKVLTSWIPIKDEDLLMKVAKTEYKLRKKRGSTG
ncbi:RabGAP/TBC [Sporormia fimetaria CBS 119925]|uniref:RabGAP/TBC n=1 Tax=Sporormia fimetaria CBS 119925 TaxID=1340428 RepID=A0A6A6V2D8_9PLEO|nr:RabGAP/TBC [Sporormia fimetaria CBS 119925]